MTERFEQSINDWYDHSRTINLEFINFPEGHKPTLSETNNNLSVLFDRFQLFTRIVLKRNRQFEATLENLSYKLSALEEIVTKNLSETHKELAQIALELRELERITKAPSLELLHKRLIELQTLDQDIGQKLGQVEQLLTKVKDYITG